MHLRNAVSEADDSVSSSRYESSAGSYTRSKQTWDVEGVGSMVVFEIRDRRFSCRPIGVEGALRILA
jgi:hypothetical protein